MIIALFILIGLVIYFIIGRVVINLIGEWTDADFDDWKGFAIFIFPLVFLWAIIMLASDYLTEAIQEFVENMNKKEEK
jgi:hypothetical protein